MRRAMLGLIAVALATSALAHDATSIVDNLPRSYIGHFQWHGATGRQRVEINFKSVAPLASGVIVAVGCGRYEDGVVTHIGIRMHIELPSRQVEIWEFSPVGSASFTVDGSHKGSLSDDLQDIAAEWTTRSTGQQGHLRLRAGGTAERIQECGAIALSPGADFGAVEHLGSSRPAGERASSPIKNRSSAALGRPDRGRALDR